MIVSSLCCCWSSSFNDKGLEDSLLGPTPPIRSTDEELPPFLASSSYLSYSEKTEGKTIRKYHYKGTESVEFRFFPSHYERVSNDPENNEKYFFNNGVLQSVILGSKVKMQYNESQGEIKIINPLNGASYKTYKINKPWIQEWHIGLKSFFFSNEESIIFFIVNPNTYVLHEMTAKKRPNFELEIFPSIPLGQRFWNGVAIYDDDGILQTYTANQVGQTPVEMVRDGIDD